MYNEFYGLREAPFHITPDPRFLFFSDKHREAFNHILFGIRERKGFIQITGEVGAGKTTVCRAILAELDSSYRTALLWNPALTGTQLLRAILVELGAKPKKLDRAGYLEALNRLLLDAAAKGEDVVLFLDEAQNLDAELLEQVRDRVLEAAEYIPVDRLGTTDDCGFAPFGDDISTARDCAVQKIRARVVGTDMAVRHLGVA